MKRYASLPDRLNICLLSYRSNPHSGGQGIYLKNLARELKDLGHRVAVVAGPPGPVIRRDIPVHLLPGLDLYNPADPFRTPRLKELADPVNLMEWLGVITGGFPEPLTFGLRAHRFVNRYNKKFDIIHDNQGLSYGIHLIGERLPLVTTIHHPISVDRKIAVRNASSLGRKIQQLRWHSFLGMQKRVARSIAPIITVSRSARDDIAEQFGIERRRFAVISNGVDFSLFRPLAEVRREKNRVITINSADVPLKGLGFLLRAVADLKAQRKIRLIVVGTAKKNGTIRRLVGNLGIGDQVTFTGRIDDAAFIREYARAEVAVIPSVYEGFGLPAAEAMACAVPVISTTGGALPEVVGDAGVLVAPANHEALAEAMAELLGDPTRLDQMGQDGFERARRYFSWQRTACKTVDIYRQAINDDL